MASAQWNWTYGYCDPVRHSRTLGTGFHAIAIAPGPFPAGYRIANGRDGGGFPAAGQQSNGRLPIRIQPPPSGNGRLTFVVNAKLLVHNPSQTQVVEVATGLGVSDVSGPSRPMSPYLGVAHDRDPWTDSLVYSNVAPRQTVQLTMFRLDLVDNAFAAVPGWPNWRMLPATGSKLWPAVCPMLRIKGGSVVVSGVFCMGHVS